MEGIEELRLRRDEVTRQIIKEEEEKNRIQNELRVLSEKLNRLNDGLSRKLQAKQEYERTLQETEAAYNKVRSSATRVCNNFHSNKINFNRFWRVLKHCFMC